MDTLRPLWRQRAFLLLFGGQGISIIGSMLSSIARPFLVFQIGGGATEVGMVLALSSLPFVILGLPAGAWIDRWDRKRTMALSDAGRGIAVGSLVVALLSGHLSLLLICASAVLEGICSVFFSLAETASLPQVVASEQLSTAAAYNQALFSIAFVVGPPLGGVLFTVNPLLPFGLDALSFLISMVTLLAITIPFQQSRLATKPHLLREIGEGLAWLWREPISRYLTVMQALIGIALGGSALVIIRLVAHALPYASARTLPAITGTLLTFAGIGGILGAILSPRLLRRFTLPHIIGGSLWLQGAIMTLLIMAPGYWGLATLFVASYCLWPAFNASLTGYRLARIPDQLQGRVNSVYQLSSYAADPVGALLIGLLLAHMGIVVTALARGILVLGIAVLTTLVLRKHKSRDVTSAAREHV